MAHPFHEHRQHRVEKSRVSHLTHGYAHGGSVHSDAGEDKKMIKSMVKPKALKVHGKKSGGRLDRYARGGKVKGKGKGHTSVNIMVGHPGAGAPPPMPIPAMPPQGAAPMMPPRPAMPPQMAGGPGPSMGGSQPMPPQMPIRRSGGRAYAKGGAVKDGPAWKEGLRNGTQVSHTDGKSDTKDIVRPRQVTYKRGGKVEASSKVVHNIDDGAGSGPGRIEKIALQKRK